LRSQATVPGSLLEVVGDGHAVPLAGLALPPSRRLRNRLEDTLVPPATELPPREACGLRPVAEHARGMTREVSR